MTRNITGPLTESDLSPGLYFFCDQDSDVRLTQKIAARFKRAAELLELLNAAPSTLTFDRPHVWRGRSAPWEPSGIWIDPDAEGRDEALGYGAEIHALLRAKFKA